MNNSKYVIYCRKSSERKEKQVASISDQISECTSFASTHQLNIISVITEERSAFKPNNRPKFNSLIELIKSGEVEGIITWKPDRLARNPEEGGKIMQMLQDNKLKEIKTPYGDSYIPSSDHLVLLIHFGMANQYSRNLSDNVKRGTKYKIARGEYPTHAPLGYENHGDSGKRNIKPIEFDARILKEIFTLASNSNYSLSKLCKYAKEQGLKHRSGKYIGKSSMQRILTNPVYYGCFKWNGELYQGNYEPILPKRLFDTAQVALADRNKPKQTKHNNPYNGILKCGYCGCGITTTVKNKTYKRTKRTVTYIYHHCSKRRGDCGLQSFSTEKLEKFLYDNLAYISIDEEVWRLGLELVKKKHEDLTSLNSERRKMLLNEYSAGEDRLNKLINLRLNGELTQQEMAQAKSKLIEDQAGIKSMINDNENSEHGWLELTEEFLNTAFHAKEILEEGNPFEKKELVKKLGQNLFLNNENLVVTLKEPYDVLLKPAMRSSWLGVRDSNPDNWDQNPESCR